MGLLLGRNNPFADTHGAAQIPATGSASATRGTSSMRDPHLPLNQPDSGEAMQSACDPQERLPTSPGNLGRWPILRQSE